MRKTKHYSKYFYGNKISEYGLQEGYLDYSTLAKAFDAVLNNEIIEVTEQAGMFWEMSNCYIDNTDAIEELQEEIDAIKDSIEACETLLDQGMDPEMHLEELESALEEKQDELYDLEQEDGTPNFYDIFQYFIISDRGAEIIEEYTDDPLFYNEDLDMWVWGVTHWGTAWSYVLTSVKLELEETE